MTLPSQRICIQRHRHFRKSYYSNMWSVNHLVCTVPWYIMVFSFQLTNYQQRILIFSHFCQRHNCWNGSFSSIKNEGLRCFSSLLKQIRVRLMSSPGSFSDVSSLPQRAADHILCKSHFLQPKCSLRTKICIHSVRSDLLAFRLQITVNPLFNLCENFWCRTHAKELHARKIIQSAKSQFAFSCSFCSLRSQNFTYMWTW